MSDDGVEVKAREQPDPTPVRRMALIFVPAMGEALIDQSADGLATRLADALNRRARTGSARFAVDPQVRQETFGDERHTTACSIIRTDSDAEVATIDLYRLDGVRALRGAYAESGFLLKAALPALVLASYVPRARKARKRKAKDRRERLQLSYGVGVLALLSVYLLVLIVTGVAATLNVVDPHILDVIPRRVQALWEGGVTLATALGLWKSKWLGALASGAIGYVAVARYLDQGERRPNLTGELAGLLEHLAEKDTSYDRIDVLAFSFGGIAAIDAFFPEDSPPADRFSEVRTLVTIGCPFDFVRAYWPDYFNRRHLLPAAPRDWLNVYTPIDILSSNFRDDSDVGDATLGVPTDAATPRLPDNLAYRSGKRIDDMTNLEFLAFTGLSSHTIYWGHRRESEDTVFKEIVPLLYAGEAILA